MPELAEIRTRPLERDVVDIVKFPITQLDELFQENPEAIKFGPTYKVNTSKGEPIQVLTIFHDNPEMSNQSRTYYHIAVDSDLHVVGFRHTQVSQIISGSSKKIVADSSVAVLRKNMGIGSVMTITKDDTLQREANRRGKPIEVETFNENAKNFNLLKQQYDKTGDPSLLPKLKEKEAEQQRWATLFGVEDRENIHMVIRRVISPIQNIDDLELIDEIEITRMRSNDKAEDIRVTQKRVDPTEKNSISHLKRELLGSTIAQFKSLLRAAPPSKAA